MDINGVSSMNHIQRLVLMSLVVVLLSACVTSPTGRRQLMLVSEDSAIVSSKEAYLSTVNELNQAGKIDKNRSTRSRVDEVTGRLIAQAIEMRSNTADWEWSVVVIDDPEMVNAWCMAGGRMAIYTGLLDQVKPTDAELAQVMGHEIAHALANHTAEKMSMQIATSIGVAVVGIASDNTGVALTGAALAAMLAVNLPNSRSAETEADVIGMELAAKAGYDPSAAATFWEKMGKVSPSSTPQLLSTHPSSASRTKALAELAPEMMQYYDPNAAHPVYKLKN
jgi:predicted Zn-dependent protease